MIVNYHANIRLSLTTVVRLATLCIQKKKKRKENTQKRKKKKSPNPTSIHARQMFVKPFLDNAVKRNFQIPFQQRGSKIRITHELHTYATWRDLTYTALTFYTATRTRKRASIIRTVTEPTFSPPHINPSPRAICKLKMALRRGEKNFVARRITRISG